jgi:hypothetical protein
VIMSDIESDSLVECGDVEAPDFSEMMQLFSQIKSNQIYTGKKVY